MKTVIIPVDFSETSLNAARYGAGLLTGQPGTTVILYNMFDKEEESVRSRRIPGKPESGVIAERCSRSGMCKRTGETT